MNEQVLIRFLKHSCTPEELKDIEVWIATDTSHADWLFEMERIWSLKDELAFSDEKAIEKAYRTFLSNIRKRKAQKRRHLLTTVFRYAAAILLAGLLTSNIIYMAKGRKIEEVTNTIEVPLGHRASLTLSDGTKVWLNSGSRLNYPAQFSNNERKVFLTGEAYFEVRRDEKKNFIVHSETIDIKVLGTKFNVKAYPKEETVVTLTEGKVELHTENAHIAELTPNQQAKYSLKGELAIETISNLDAIQAWTKGELYFVESALKEIVQALERRFNVKIDIKNDDLADDIFTCHFKETDNLEFVLSLLKETKRLNYKYTKNGNIEIINYK